MDFKKETYEPGEMKKAIEAYLARGTKKDGQPFCPCGKPIRVGFVATFPVDREGNVLETTETPRKVPYCDACDPPDGFNHSYARRVFIYEA